MKGRGADRGGGCMLEDDIATFDTSAMLGFLSVILEMEVVAHLFGCAENRAVCIFGGGGWLLDQVFVNVAFWTGRTARVRKSLRYSC